MPWSKRASLNFQSGSLPSLETPGKKPRTFCKHRRCHITELQPWHDFIFTWMNPGKRGLGVVSMGKATWSNFTSGVNWKHIPSTSTSSRNAFLPFMCLNCVGRGCPCLALGSSSMGEQTLIGLQSVDSEIPCPHSSTWRNIFTAGNAEQLSHMTPWSSLHVLWTCLWAYVWLLLEMNKQD